MGTGCVGARGGQTGGGFFTAVSNRKIARRVGPKLARQSTSVRSRRSLGYYYSFRQFFRVESITKLDRRVVRVGSLSKSGKLAGLYGRDQRGAGRLHSGPGSGRAVRG